MIGIIRFEQEQPLLTAYSPSIWIRQKSSTQLYVEHSSNFSTTLRSEISAITGLCLNERNLAITNQKNIAIYKIPRPDEFKDAKNNKNVSIKHVQTFNVTDCMQIFIYDEMLIVVGYQNVRIYSFGGIVLKEINFNDNEGNFLCLLLSDSIFKSNILKLICFLSNRNTNRSIINAEFHDHFYNERLSKSVRCITT